MKKPAYQKPQIIATYSDKEKKEALKALSNQQSMCSVSAR